MSVKNFVQCGLVTPVAANTVELVLAAPTASYQYPPLDGGTLVIADSVTRPSFYEIISYTHRINNVLYGVVRAKEGTTARAWTGSVWVYQALTAQDYVDALALKAALASPAFTGIPTAPTAALGTNTNQIATMAALKQAIDALVGGAPGVLDALNEFAAALGNDPNFATTMTNALAGKEPSIAAGTSAQMWLGNKTWASVLSQVQNTLLTGLGVGSNATIVSTDTLIAALAKIQNQLNNKVESTDTRLTNAREWTATDVTQAEAEAGSVTVARKWSPLRVWQAVLGSKLTGINLTLGTAVSATDTVLIALGKLQKQITDAATNLAGNVRATVLTGYVNGSAATLAATDTILGAFGKLQAQITSLSGSKLDASANAVSATKLQTARTISLSGDVTGSGSFDGSGNLTIAATVADNSHNHTIANVDGLQAALSAASGLAQGGHAQDPNGAVNQVILSNHANTPNGILGTAFYWHITTTFYSTISAASNRAQIAVQYNGGNQCFARSCYDNVWTGWIRLDNSSVNAAALTGVIADARLSGTYTGVNITGNAATATKLQTARTIALTGGVTGSGSFDGTGNLTITATVDANSHNHSYLPLAGGAMNGSVYFNSYGTNFIGAGNGDAANSALANIKLYSWNGIGFAPSISGQPVPQYENAVFIDVRHGDLTARRNIVGNSCYASNWFRSSGNTGWFNETYGGGIYMADSTFVRTSGGKAFYCDGGEIVVAGAYPKVRLHDTDWGDRSLYHDAGLIGFLNSSGGWSFYNDDAGNTTSIGSVTAYSDIRLKKDIEVIPAALAKVMALRGVTYSRVDTGERQTGVIAQEVQAVLPEAVMTGADEQQTLSVAYGNLVGLLVEAIKELRAEVEELKNGTA